MSDVHGADDKNVQEITYNGKPYVVMDYDITTKKVSVHYPLTRLLAGLLVEFGKSGISLEEAKFTALDLRNAADKSMRVLALCAQVNIFFGTFLQLS